VSTDLYVGLFDDKLWDEEVLEGHRDTLAALWQALRDGGVGDYEEPTDIRGRGWSIRLYPSNGLAFLQRLAAYFPDPDDIEEWPTPGDPKTMLNPLLDEMVDESYHLDQEGPFQHLIFHNPKYGFWVPVDFPDVIMPEKEVGVGNFVGSSVRLLQECVRLAEILEMPLTLEPDDKRLWHLVDHPGKGRAPWERYSIESFNLVRLYHACRQSLELGAALFIT
jgi:hypothetical protein